MPDTSSTPRLPQNREKNARSAPNTLVMRGPGKTTVIRGSTVPSNAPAAETELQSLSVPPASDPSKEGTPLEKKRGPLDPSEIEHIRTKLSPALQPDSRRGKLDPVSKSQAIAKSVKHAHELLRNEERGTLEKLWQKGRELYQRVLGIPATKEPPCREVIQESITRNVSALKAHYEKELKPVVDAVRAKYHERTFIPDPSTPRVLKLAAIPLSKVGNIISMETLALGVQGIAHRRQADSVTVAKDIGPDRIAISRVNSAGTRESLEFSFRRPGKVDVVLNGRVVGNLWNDDALKAAEWFAAGRGFSMTEIKKEQKKKEAYIVV